MRTFLEAIEQKKTNKIAYECFISMGENGINPISYVTWFNESGLKSPNLLSESRDWLNLEIDLINEAGGAAHALGWAAGSLPRWGAQAAKGVAGWGLNQLGSFGQGATTGLGQGVDDFMDRKGIQDNFASPTKKYNADTGHYVKWNGEGPEDPSKTDQWIPVDHEGNPLPPNSPPPAPPTGGGGSGGGPAPVGGGSGGGPAPVDGGSGGGPAPVDGGGSGGGSGNPIEQAAMQAVKALQDVMKRAGRQGSKLSQANLQQVLMSLTNALQDKASFAADEPQAGQSQAGQSLDPNMAKLGAFSRKQANPQGNDNQDLRKTMGVPEPANKKNWYDWNTSNKPVIQEKNMFTNVLHKKLVEIRVRDVCNKFADLQVDPRMFAEWYINEGIHYETEKQFNEGFGQWLGGLGGAVKGAWNAGVDSFKNKPLGSMWDSIKGGWQQGWSDNDEKYDQQSVQAAIEALKPLIGKAPKLDQQIQAVSQQLQGFLGGTPAAAEPAAAKPAGSGMDMSKLSGKPAGGAKDLSGGTDPAAAAVPAAGSGAKDLSGATDPAAGSGMDMSKLSGGAAADPAASDKTEPAAPESPREVEAEKQTLAASSSMQDFVASSLKKKGNSAAKRMAKQWDKLSPQAQQEFTQAVEQHKSSGTKGGLGSNIAFKALAAKYLNEPAASPDVSQPTEAQPDQPQSPDQAQPVDPAEAEYQAFKAARKKRAGENPWGVDPNADSDQQLRQVAGESHDPDEEFFRSILGGKKKLTWFS